MATTTLTSESLIGSLCREVATLRQSWQVLNGLLIACHDQGLRRRLGREAARLQCRRLEIQRLARAMERLPLRDPLGASFLLEVAGRSLPT